MRESSEHARYVDTWIERLPVALAPAQLVSAFEQGLGVLWRRAQRTLGDVTVSAIADRVLHDASARAPLLSVLKVEPGVGVQFEGLRRRVGVEEVEQLRHGIRETLILFLTVMGNLTGEILTPALHVELGNARFEDFGVTGPSSNGDRAPHHRVELMPESRE